VLHGASFSPVAQRVVATSADPAVRRSDIRVVLVQHGRRGIGGEERELGARPQPKLAEHLGELGADVDHADPEALGDLLVGKPLGDEPSDPRLAQAQPAQPCFHGHPAQRRAGR
jgi:hypothetical protein